MYKRKIFVICFIKNINTYITFFLDFANLNLKYWFLRAQNLPRKFINIYKHLMNK